MTRRFADALSDFTFVSYSGLPELDPDDRLAADVLRQRGWVVAVAVWDDPGVRWSRGGTCIIRSTWDYHLRAQEFLKWAGRVSRCAPLYNPLKLLRWNIHKSYLQKLEARSVPVVPTHWIKRGTPIDLRALLDSLRLDRAVAKPAIGLATYDVHLLGADSKGQEMVNRLVNDHDLLLQPYLSSVERYGERSLVFIGGMYSHAVRKTPFQILAPAGEAGESPVDATADEIAVGEAAMQALGQPALYGRVDVLQSDGGKPVVIEMELIEPSLFLSMHPKAPSRFADALVALPRRRRA